MATTTKARKPLSPVTGTCRWVGPVDQGILNAGNALLMINGEGYWVRRTADSYRLSSLAGKTYTVPAHLRGGCSCPDATNRPDRPEGCKHRKALLAALKAKGLVA